MHNRKFAEEWLAFAEKSLETAILLNRENHYTDVIAIDIQQTVEKALKALYAFEGIKIPRTHSLDILFNIRNEHCLPSQQQQQKRMVKLIPMNTEGRETQTTEANPCNCT